jgi:hypothetical protein
MSIDFSPVIEVLTSFTSKKDLDQFLIKHKFTFRSYPSKSQTQIESADDLTECHLTSVPNVWIYIIKHPYNRDETEQHGESEHIAENADNHPQIVIEGNHKLDDHNSNAEVPDIALDDPRLELLHRYGRGIVMQINMGESPFKINLMSIPLPFGNSDYLKNKEINGDDDLATVLVDGTGFNVSRDPLSGLLFVSTRACGGYYPEGPLNYYNNSKYRYGTMFRESLNYSQAHSDDNTKNTTNNENGLLSMPIGLCLHLVMNHPNDSKVFPCASPSITLVAAHQINGFVATPLQSELSTLQTKINTSFNVPIQLSIKNEQELYTFLADGHPRVVAGIKLYNKSTNTWSKRMLTKRYERVRDLVGSDTNVVFTLIRLRHAGGQYKKHMRLNGMPLPEGYVGPIEEFLQYFPEHTKTYQVVVDLCKSATGDLLDWYLRVYANPTANKHKYIEETLTSVPREFNDLVQHLHLNYKNKKTEYTLKLKSGLSDAEIASLAKPETRHKDVMEFFNNMPPARIYDRLRQYTSRKMSELQHNFNGFGFNLAHLFEK